MKVILLIVTLFTALGCATEEAVRRSLTNINEELVVMQKSITDNQIALEEINAITVATQAEIAANTDAIAELRAEIAYVNNELILLKNTGVSKNSGRSRVNQNALKGTDRSTPIIIEETDVEGMIIDLNKKSSTPDIVIIDDAVATKSSTYSFAMELLKSKKYTDSRARFQEYIDKYPGDSLASNAQYWIGETYYSLNNMNDALNAFEMVVANYPRSSKVPDAHLKIAFIKDVTGKRPEAVEILNTVITSYPKSTSAKLAKQKLRAWGR